MMDQSTGEKRSGRAQVQILECTLRDGSYAVDFKFTERDTVTLAGVLGGLNFLWIEVGHGLGLGAARAGKGAMPASDERIIEVAKQAAPHAQVGCFFIPGVGTADNLKAARAAGLDFIRIGCNPGEAEQAFPYLSFARELGLKPFLNFMKTYSISPEVFAQKANDGAAAGAEVIYCVDSAGSMFPEDVRRYISMARDRCECSLGFHGHSNLQFAVANSVEAVRSGAAFVDTTLYGLGRSAGNVPTEVAIAVFRKLGIETGVDLFDVMDAAEELIGPLMPQMQLYDMTSVAMGSSQFHSSFLPRVADAASKHRVDLRRLVAAMGELDSVNLDDGMLNRVAVSLPKVTARKPYEPLTSFSARGISANNISTSLSAVQSLIDGMAVTCAKRRAQPVLELVAAESHDPDLVLSDLVLAEGPAILGKVVYGSFEVLVQVLRMTRDSVELFLNDRDGGCWASEWPASLCEIVEPERVLPVHSRRLHERYMEDVIAAAAQKCGDFCLMIYGSPSAGVLRYCCEIFDSVVVHGHLPSNAPENCWQIADFSDRMHFDLQIGVALLLCAPTGADVASLDQLLMPQAILVANAYFSHFEKYFSGRRIFRLNASDAYRGQIERWLALSNRMKSTEHATAVAQ
jgi:4-hydroxy 2-oxovalerate aldolase